MTVPLQRKNIHPEAPTQPSQPIVGSPRFAQQRPDFIELPPEEGCCERLTSFLSYVLLSAWDLFVTRITPKPALVEDDTEMPSPAMAPAPVVEDVITTYINSSYQNATLLEYNFPALPQEFKDYVYANLPPKEKGLMQWKRSEGMTDDNAIFAELLRTGYIQNYEALHKIFVQYQQTV